MPPFKERRKKPRTRLEAQAIIFLGNEQVGCKILNISAAGVALATRKSCRVGTFLRGQLFMPNQTKWLPFDGTLAREEKKEDRYIWGIEFVSLESWVKASIESLVREGLKAEARDKIKGTARLRKPSPQAKPKDEGTQRDRELAGLYNRAVDFMDQPGKPEKKR